MGYAIRVSMRWTRKRCSWLREWQIRIGVGRIDTIVVHRVRLEAPVRSHIKIVSEGKDRTLLDRRLSGTVPALAEVIAAADEVKQRQVALAAVEYAFGKSPQSIGLQEASDALRSRQFGDSPIRQWLRKEFLGAKVQSAKAFDVGDDDLGRGYSRYAQALAAAHYALLENAEEAALEAVYEARHVGTEAEISAVVARVVNSA